LTHDLGAKRQNSASLPQKRLKKALRPPLHAVRAVARILQSILADRSGHKDTVLEASGAERHIPAFAWKPNLEGCHGDETDHRNHPAAQAR
jgi:hypothetical protein